MTVKLKMSSPNVVEINAEERAKVRRRRWRLKSGALEVDGDRVLPTQEKMAANWMRWCEEHGHEKTKVEIEHLATNDLRLAKVLRKERNALEIGGWGHGGVCVETLGTLGDAAPSVGGSHCFRAENCQLKEIMIHLGEVESIIGQRKELFEKAALFLMYHELGHLALAADGPTEDLFQKIPDLPDKAYRQMTAEIGGAEMGPHLKRGTEERYADAFAWLLMKKRDPNVKGFDPNYEFVGQLVAWRWGMREAMGGTYNTCRVLSWCNKIPKERIEAMDLDGMKHTAILLAQADLMLHFNFMKESDVEFAAGLKHRQPYAPKFKKVVESAEKPERADARHFRRQGGKRGSP